MKETSQLCMLPLCSAPLESRSSPAPVPSGTMIPNTIVAYHHQDRGHNLLLGAACPFSAPIGVG